MTSRSTDSPTPSPSGTLHLEPFGGLAGDMLLAALLDLGDPRFELSDLRALAEALVPGEARLELERVERGSLMGTLLTVRAPESGHPPHRHLADCLALIEGAPLSPAARQRAGAVFRRIALAEAHVHGRDIEEVHFHEVGAVDALIDICGAALALDRLGVGEVIGSPPLVGSGTVRCAHGEMPVPAPGTAEIMRGLETTAGGTGERLTPTGAALFAEYVVGADLPGGFVAETVGYGAGHRNPESGPPNLVRVRLGRVVSGVAGTGEASGPSAWLMEFNLDDLAGEAVGFLVQQLRAAGALEVWTQAVQMKKDRPGVVVSCLCRAPERAVLERVAFEQSTTLGVRWAERQRTECERESLAVTAFERSFRVQRRLRPGGGELLASDLKVEHDDLAAAARELGRPLAELERVVLAAARAQLGV